MTISLPREKLNWFYWNRNSFIQVGVAIFSNNAIPIFRVTILTPTICQNLLDTYVLEYYYLQQKDKAIHLSRTTNAHRLPELLKYTTEPLIYISSGTEPLMHTKN